MNTPPPALPHTRPAPRAISWERGVAAACSVLIHAALFITVPTCEGPILSSSEAEVEANTLSLVDLAALGDLQAVEELDTGADASKGSAPTEDDPGTAEDLRDEALVEADHSADDEETYEAEGLLDDGGSTDDATGDQQGNTQAPVETQSDDEGAGPEEESTSDAVADAHLDEETLDEEPSEGDEEPVEDPGEEDAPEEDAEEEGEEEEEEDAPALSEFVSTAGSLTASEADPDSNTIAEVDQTAEFESRSVLLRRSRKQELGTTDKTTTAQEERRKAGSSDAIEGVRVAGGRLDRAEALRRGAVNAHTSAANTASRSKPTLHLAHASASVRPLPVDYREVVDTPRWWEPTSARISVPARGTSLKAEAPNKTSAPVPTEEVTPPSPPQPEPAPPTPVATPEPKVAPLPPPTPEPIEAPRTAAVAQDGALDSVADIDREGDQSEGGVEVEAEPPPEEADERPVADTDGLLLVDKGVQGAEDGDVGATVEAPSLFEPMFDSAPSLDDATTHVTGTESTLSQRYVLGLDNAISARRTPLGAYTHKVYRKLLRNWERLPDPDMGYASFSRQVTISFLVFPDGRVVRAKVKSTSGDPMLDGMALESVPKSLPNFPNRLEESSLYYEMTFTYGEGG